MLFSFISVDWMSCWSSLAIPLCTAIKDFLVAKKEEVEKIITEEAYNLDYFVSDSLIDGEYDDLEVDAGVEEFNVVEVADGEAVVTAFCTLKDRCVYLCRRPQFDVDRP